MEERALERWLEQLGEYWCVCTKLLIACLKAAGVEPALIENDGMGQERSGQASSARPAFPLATYLA